MFKPTGHRLVVHRNPVEEYSPGGIIQHASEESKKLKANNSQLGVIVAIGPDAWKAFRMINENGKEVSGKPWAKVGDYVLYIRNSAREVSDPFSPNQKDLVMMADEDVLAVITKEATVIPESKVRDAARGEE